MSAGYDAEVADLFRDLRAASNLTEADLAARIATPVEVVQALEQGAIYALPPWPETCRVVSAYGTILNLDTRPLLRRIYAQLEAGVVELGPKPVQDVPVMVPPAAATPTAPAQPGPAAQPAPQAQAAPQPAQAPAGVANGTPQPQASPLNPQQLAPQQPAPQQVTPQQPAPPAQQPPGWPSGLTGAPQPLQPPQPQAVPPAPWPGAAPQTPPGAQSPQDAAWPGAAPGGQGQPVPPAPQPQAAPAQPQADASFPDASFPTEPPVYPQQPGQVPHPGAQPDPALAGAPIQAEDASFLGEPELELVEEEEEEAETKSRKSPLLKWGIIGLLAVVLLLGLWMVLGGSSGEGGLSSGFSTSDPVLDPDDPRSRKADRLPNNF
ncbi:MAG: helix-turn-helix transcriptional regulator [Pseudomonadota bacterium]